MRAIKLNYIVQAFVDDDEPPFERYRWKLQPATDKTRAFVYIQWESKARGATTEMLHRIVASRMLGRPLSRSELVEAIDGNLLNCCRSNLRIISVSQHSHEMGARSDNRSGYRGVSYHKKTGKWEAKITIAGKRKFLGLFNTPEEANQAYCEARQAALSEAEQPEKGEPGRTEGQPA